MKITREVILILTALLIVTPIAFAGTSGPTPVPNPPNFYITSNATLLCKGEVNNIPITITNGGAPYSVGTTSIEGPAMENTQLSIASSRYLFSMLNSTVNAGVVNAKNSTTMDLPIFVSPNASSIVSLGIYINYQYYVLYADSESRNLSFSANTCPTPLSIGISPEVVTAGNIQNITLNLTNTGNATLSSVYIKLSLPGEDGAILAGQPFFLKDLKSKQSVSINESAYIFKNASQTIALNLSASFYNHSNLTQISNSILLLSTGIINITPSSFTISPQTPAPGSIFSISFVLTNIGTTSASALTVTALPPEGFSSFGANSVFVGDVAVDSQTPVTISLVSDNAIKSGSYNIPIRVNYLNSLRSNISGWANTTIYVEGSQSSGLNATREAYTKRASGARGLIFLLIIILIVIIIVLSVMLARAKRRTK